MLCVCVFVNLKDAHKQWNETIKVNFAKGQQECLIDIFLFPKQYFYYRNAGIFHNFPPNLEFSKNFLI